MNYIIYNYLAERARFELAVPFRARQFSRLLPSTTRPPLHCDIIQNIGLPAGRQGIIYKMVLYIIFYMLY